jgi:hypothetical protein
LAIFWGKRKRKLLLVAGKFKPATIERGNVPRSFSPPPNPTPPTPNTKNLKTTQKKERRESQFIYTRR